MFFLLYQFLSFFYLVFFFVYLKLIFGLFVLALTKETKNLKLKATKFKHLTQSQGSIFFFFSENHRDCLALKTS